MINTNCKNLISKAFSIIKLYNVVKYRNEVLSADKILANCRLVSFGPALITSWVWAGWELSKPLAQKFLSTNQRQGGDQKTKIWKAKNKYIFYFLHFLIPPAHQLKFVHFFSTQPLTTYFTLQRYWAWLATGSGHRKNKFGLESFVAKHPNSEYCILYV